MWIEPHDLIGRQVGKYRFLERIGRGGMAFVYRGEHVDMAQPIAIKVLFQKHSQSPEKRARFHREAQLQFRLRHPHLVRSFDLIDEQGILGIVMDWVDGFDLATHTEQHGGRLGLTDLKPLFFPVLEVVHYAHRQGIIHRDLKPANILIEHREGQTIPKVLDFGIAKLLNDTEWQTEEGVLLGTPAYLAPEQAERAQIDHRVDIYALGITFYQLATGQLPFSGETVLEVLLAHRDKNPPPMRFWDPAIPPSIDYVIQKALAKNPNERFENCDVFADALQAAYVNEHYPFVSLNARASESIASTKTEISLSPHLRNLEPSASSLPDPQLFPRLAALAKHRPPPDPSPQPLPNPQNPSPLSTTWSPPIPSPLLLPTEDTPTLTPPKPLKNTFTQITQISLAAFSAPPQTTSTTSRNNNALLTPHTPSHNASPMPRTPMPRTPSHNASPMPRTPMPRTPSHEALPTVPSPSYDALPTVPSPSYGELPTVPSPSYGDLPTVPSSPSYGSLSAAITPPHKLSAPPLSSRIISPTDPTDVSPPPNHPLSPLSESLRLLDPNDEIDSMILRLYQSPPPSDPPTPDHSTPIPPLSPPADSPHRLDFTPEQLPSSFLSEPVSSEGIDRTNNAPLTSHPSTRLPAHPSFDVKPSRNPTGAPTRLPAPPSFDSSLPSHTTARNAVPPQKNLSAKPEGFDFRIALFFGLLIGFLLFLVVRFFPR
ncbi:protein kinase [Myxococcota bacterium]|nr:protein kinase [Myxococcota bacterium]